MFSCAFKEALCTLEKTAVARDRQGGHAAPEKALLRDAGLLRLAIPAWSNEYSILLKDSALAFTIGVLEVMARTRSVAATTHQPLPLSILAGALFFFLTWAGIKTLKRLEAKVRIPGYAHQGSL